MSLEDILRSIIREELAALKFSGKTPVEEDQLLTASEAAHILRVSEGYLYKVASTAPYAVRLGENVVRFSKKKIQEEIQRRLKLQGSGGTKGTP